MPFFRKIPVVVEARRFVPIEEFEDNWREFRRQAQDLADWCGGILRLPLNETAFIIVSTLEGDMKAGQTDWIIQGVENEYYPCKDQVFLQIYEITEEKSCLSTSSAS
jgi:hypothetical protein